MILVDVACAPVSRPAFICSLVNNPLALKTIQTIAGTQTHTYTYTDTQTQTHRHRYTDTDTQTQIHRHTDTQIH